MVHDSRIMIPSSIKTGQPRWVKVSAILSTPSEGVGTPRSAVGKLVRNWRELHAVCIRWQVVYLAVAATYVSREGRVDGSYSIDAQLTDRVTRVVVFARTRQ